jgi:hypothetical protein
MYPQHFASKERSARHSSTHRAHIVRISVRRLPEESYRLRRDALEPQKSYRIWLDEQKSRCHDVVERRQELAAIKNAMYALEGKLNCAQASGVQNACRECGWAHSPPWIPSDTTPAKQLHVIPPPAFGTRESTQICVGPAEADHNLLKSREVCSIDHGKRVLEARHVRVIYELEAGQGCVWRQGGRSCFPASAMDGA